LILCTDLVYADEFAPIPRRGHPLDASPGVRSVGLIEVVPDSQNQPIASDINGPKARVFYRGWAYYDRPSGKSVEVAREAVNSVALEGNALRAKRKLTREDQAEIDELTSLLESLPESHIPVKQAYFHWAAVGERYAVLVGIGDVTWIDMVDGPVPQLYVLARTPQGWELLLSTHLSAFAAIDPPKVRISEILLPFLARSHHAEHPIPQYPGPIERRGKLVDNPILVGLKVYNRERCWACHRIEGAGGLLGPDLTHMGSRMPSVAWHSQHDKFPRTVQPRSIMPDYDHLSAEEQRALSQFLVSLK
jgi:hypothetical protein